MFFNNIYKYSKKSPKRIIIIGSGPAGISLALELEKRKIHSIILEAGNLEYNEESQKFYHAKVIGDHLVDDIKYSRLRMFGGTSGHWGGTCRTLDSYDFNSWLIEKKDLQPYLKIASEILNIKPLFREKKINDDFKIVEFQTSNVKFGEKYKNHIDKSNYIDIIFNSPVTNIIGKEGLTEKLEVKFENQKYYISGSKYVLATGGIENSRILLWSREMNKNFIDKNLPIGNNWYTHPYHILGKGFTNYKTATEYFKHNLIEFENAFGWGKDTKTFNVSPTRKFIKDKQILNSCIFITTFDRKNNNLKNIVKNLLCIAPQISHNLLKKFEKKIFCGTTFSSSWEQNPNFQNKIRLSNELDGLGVPFANIYYKKDDIVRKTARVMMEELGKLYVNKNIGRVSIDEFLYNNMDYKTDGGGQHHLGGTIMGSSNANSVVDVDLKLHSNKNLFVLGSSVYPSGGHANPTFTIVQLACRLADKISTEI